MSSYNKSSLTGLFSLFALILFIVVYSHYIRTGNFIDFNFKSLLDYFSSMPDISVSLSSVDLTIHGDWGIFDFFRTFLNGFSSILEISVSFIGMIGQALIVLFYLAGLCFI